MSPLPTMRPAGPSPTLDWQSIRPGETWIHRKTGKTCIVLCAAGSALDAIEVQHASGLLRRKQVLAFLREYAPST